MIFEEICMAKCYNDTTKQFDNVLFRDIIYKFEKIFYFESEEACSMAHQIIKNNGYYDYYNIIFTPKTKYYAEEITYRDDYDEPCFEIITMPIKHWIADTQDKINNLNKRLKYFQDLERK